VGVACRIDRQFEPNALDFSLECTVAVGVIGHARGSPKHDAAADQHAHANQQGQQECPGRRQHRMAIIPGRPPRTTGAPMLGKESRLPDGTLDYAMLERVTWREVEAGRMNPDNWLRLGSVQICREMYDAAMQNQPKATLWQRLTRRLRAGVADRLDG
jgi:hypothetical protein